MAGKPALHMVHGEWMTVDEAARRLGVSYKTIENWCTANRHADGSRALLVEYWDLAMGRRRGELPQTAGRRPRTYWVKGRQMTMKQAARLVGVSYKGFTSLIYRRGCSVNAAVKHFEQRATRRAVEKIMAIINEARR